MAGSMTDSILRSRGSAAPPRTLALVAWLVLLHGFGCFGLPSVIPEAHADTLSYAYDGLGRLIQATDATTGQATFYGYDSVGNITSQQIVSLSTLAISGLAANQASRGGQLTIDGTGFSSTLANNTVTINGVAATVDSVSSSGTQLVVTVPSGATSGAVSVTTGSSSASSPTTVSISAATVAPTIASFAPGAGASGATVTITGANFASTPAANKVLFNGVPANVTAVTGTTLTVTVPDDVGSGLIQVITATGTATSSTDFLIPPPGYAASSLISPVQASENGGTATITVGAGQVGLVLFSGNQGDAWIEVDVAVSGSAATLEVLDPHGNVIGSGCASTSPCIYTFPSLTVTGTYAVAIANPSSTLAAPVSITTGQQSSLDLSWLDEGLHTTPDGVGATPAQEVALAFSGPAGQLTQVNVSGVFRAWTASLYNSFGQSLWSTGFSGTSTLSLPALPANGAYNLVFAPQAADSSFEYGAGIVSASALFVNGATVTVVGGGPNNLAGGGPVVELPFTGTGQSVTLIANATQGFFYGMGVYLLNGTTQTCVAYCGGNGSGGQNGGSCALSLGTLTANANYIVYLQFASAYYSAATVSLSTSAAATGCSGTVQVAPPQSRDYQLARTGGLPTHDPHRNEIRTLVAARN